MDGVRKISTACIATHNPRRPNRAVAGTRLCQGCLDALERSLRGLPLQYAALEVKLPPGVAGGQPRVSGTPMFALPVDLDVVQLRSDIAHVLVEWSGEVSRRLGVRSPDHARLEATGAFLTAQLPRVVQEPWVGDFVASTGLLWRRARSVLASTGRKRRELMNCPETDCSGVIYAYLSPADTLLPSVIRCSYDAGHEWPADRWLTLGRKIHRADTASCRVGAGNA